MIIHVPTSFTLSEKHDKEKAEKERQKQIEKENAERLAREVRMHGIPSPL